MTYPKVMFSSKSVEWATPQTFFNTLDAEFNFTLDPCATHQNAKCDRYFTSGIDGLKQDWGKERVFCNPPYGRALPHWTRKCFEASKQGALVVALLPASTSTHWFHDWVYRRAELRFVRGGLKFGDATRPAPFGSVVAIYQPYGKGVRNRQKARRDNRRDTVSRYSSRAR